MSMKLKRTWRILRSIATGAEESRAYPARAVDIVRNRIQWAIRSLKPQALADRAIEMFWDGLPRQVRSWKPTRALGRRIHRRACRVHAERRRLFHALLPQPAATRIHPRPRARDASRTTGEDRVTWVQYRRRVVLGSLAHPDGATDTSRFKRSASTFRRSAYKRLLVGYTHFGCPRLRSRGFRRQVTTGSLPERGRRSSYRTGSRKPSDGQSVTPVHRISPRALDFTTWSSRTIFFSKCLPSAQKRA